VRSEPDPEPRVRSEPDPEPRVRSEPAQFIHRNWHAITNSSDTTSLFRTEQRTERVESYISSAAPTVFYV
jgi:hypothetical protein